MNKTKGVDLWLASGTKLPKWLANREDNLGVRRTRVDGKRIRILRIEGAEARFDPGGSVSLKMSGLKGPILTFYPLAILEIRDLTGSLLERNHCLCQKCFTNTGEMQNHKPSRIAGLVDANFQCSNCGHQWQVKEI